MLIKSARVVLEPRTEQPQYTRSDLGVGLYGPVLQAHSIAHVLRNLGAALYAQHRVDVRWQPGKLDPKQAEMPTYWAAMQPLRGPLDSPHVALSWGPAAAAINRQARAQVRICTTDQSCSLDEPLLQNLLSGDIDLVLTLSPECRETWISCGVPAEQIVVFPLGIDPVVYRPDGPQYTPQRVRRYGAEPEPGAFTFLVAGYLQPRKGMAETLHAYCEAFRGRTDVNLLVKNVAAAWGKDERGSIERIIETHPEPPPVTYCDRRLSEYQLAGLLRGVGCVVSAHRREGFGLMPLQAMACGTPTIITNTHGPKQYARPDNCYLLQPDGECEAPEDSARRVTWATYERAQLSELMLQAQAGTNREQIITAGKATAAWWTWQRSAARFVDLCEERFGHVRRRPRKWHRPGYSLLMPVRNGSDKLQTTLRTLHEQREWPEVLVLDDASCEAEAGRIRDACAAYPGVRVIRSDRQLGCHGARRRMFEEARGEFIASLDADLDFTPMARDWPEYLGELWAQRGQGIVMPLMLFPPPADGSPQLVQSAGGYVNPNAPATFWLRYYMQAADEIADLQRPAEVCTASGAFQFFRADLLDRIIQDDEYFPVYYGDSDLCYRARQQGYPVWYCPELTVWHDAASWCASTEGLNTSRVAECKERFLRRWRDMLGNDFERQDETGAL